MGAPNLRTPQLTHNLVHHGVDPVHGEEQLTALVKLMGAEVKTRFALQRLSIEWFSAEK